MTLTLHYHPLASFCWKPLIALYEAGIAFDTVRVDLGDEASREAFRAVWPMLKFPVLVDSARGATVAESSAIIEYLDLFGGTSRPMLPADPDEAWQARMWDRVVDGYLHEPMQKVVGDALRPADGKDPHGVAAARRQIGEAYALLEARLDGREWLAGDFGLADCSALPALFYANSIEPIPEAHRSLRAYLARLMARPAVARVLAEAEPWFDWFPLDPKPVLTPPA